MLFVDLFKYVLSLISFIFIAEESSCYGVEIGPKYFSIIADSCTREIKSPVSYLPGPKINKDGNS